MPDRSQDGRTDPTSQGDAINNSVNREVFPGPNGPRTDNPVPVEVRNSPTGNQPGGDRIVPTPTTDITTGAGSDPSRGTPAGGDLRGTGGDTGPSGRPERTARPQLGESSLDARRDGPGDSTPLVHRTLPERPASIRDANRTAVELAHMSTPTGVAKPVTVELRDGGSQPMTRIKADDGRSVLYSRPSREGSEDYFRQQGSRLVQTDRQGNPVQNGEQLQVRQIQMGRDFGQAGQGAPGRGGQAERQFADRRSDADARRAPQQPDRPGGPKPEHGSPKPADQRAPHDTGGHGPGRQPNDGGTPAFKPSVKPADQPQAHKPVDTTPPGLVRPNHADSRTPQRPHEVPGEGQRGPYGHRPGDAPAGGQRPDRVPDNRPGDNRPGDNRSGANKPGDPGNGESGRGGRRADVLDQTTGKAPQPGDKPATTPAPVPVRDGQPGGAGGGGGRGADNAGTARGDRLPPSDKTAGGSGGVGGGTRLEGLISKNDDQKAGRIIDSRLAELMADPKLQQRLLDALQKALSDIDSIADPKVRDILRGLDAKQIQSLQLGLLDGLKNPLTLDSLDPQLQVKLRDLVEALGGKEIATARIIDGLVRDGSVPPGRETLTTMLLELEKTARLFETPERPATMILSEMISRTLDGSSTELGGSELIARLNAGDESMSAVIQRLQTEMLSLNGAAGVVGAERALAGAPGSNDTESADAASEDGADDSTVSNTDELLRISAAQNAELLTAQQSEGEDDTSGDDADGDEEDADSSEDSPNSETELTVEDGEESSKETEQEEEEENEEKRKNRNSERSGKTTEEIAALAQKKLEEERKRKEREEEAARKAEQERKEKERKNKRSSYRVRQGDSLVSIAQSQCRDKNMAGLIFEINRGQIAVRPLGLSKIAILKVGLMLTIPSETEVENHRRWGKSPADIDLSHPAGAPDVVPPAGGFASAEDELAARFGVTWSGGSRTTGRRLFNSAEEEIKGARTDEVKAKIRENRQNIEAALGPLKSAQAQAHAQSAAADDQRIRYVCRIGDTLRGIALRHAALQDVKLWELIAIINELPTELTEKGEPIVKLHRGQIVLLPTPAEIEAWRDGTFGTQSNFVVLNGDYIEMSRVSCPGCTRPALASAMVCSGCGVALHDCDESHQSVQDWSEQAPAGTASPAPSAAAASSHDVLQGIQTLIDFPVVRPAPAAGSAEQPFFEDDDDQRATSDEITGYYQLVRHDGSATVPFASYSLELGAEAEPWRESDDLAIPPGEQNPSEQLDHDWSDAPVTAEPAAPPYTELCRMELTQQSCSLNIEQINAEQCSGDTQDAAQSIVEVQQLIQADYNDADEIDEQTSTVIIKTDQISRLKKPKAEAALEEHTRLVEPTPPPIPHYLRSTVSSDSSQLQPTGAFNANDQSSNAHYLSLNTRLSIHGTADDLSQGYRVTLEGLCDGKWLPIVVYEFYEDVILHHFYNFSGERKTRRIALPIRQALQLAENDLTTNWSQYYSNFKQGT